MKQLFWTLISQRTSDDFTMILKEAEGGEGSIYLVWDNKTQEVKILKRLKVEFSQGESLEQIL